MEELQAIIQAVKEMAALGSHVGIWWIILHYAVKLAGYAMCFAAPVLIARRICRTVQSHMIGPKLCDILGIECGGYYSGSNERQLINRVVELQRNA